MSGKIKKHSREKKILASGHDAPWPAPWRRLDVIFICSLLLAMVFAVFGQTIHHGFVNYDDNEYVYENGMVSRGLTLEGIIWAFTHVHAENWHPLTTISHMLDCQIYGLQAGGHHFTNIFLHASAAVLLFFMLLEMTGMIWRSGLVAAFFAVHPLRVESVAWVAERKDVLSGIFFILTLWAYVRYVRHSQSPGGYAWVIIWFTLGLVSKPMLVTLPFVLLLLDYWPLGRLKNQSLFPRLTFEKWPLIILSSFSCVATVMAQNEAIQPLDRFPFSMRVGNAMVAYCVYLEKFFYPVKLAVLYPFLQNGWPAWRVISAILLLNGFTLAVFVLRRKQPFLLVGWLWYLGMLVPVAGILQVGGQAYADRYTYLPQIGLCIACVWLLADWTGRGRSHRLAMSVAAGGALCALLLTAYRQTTFWRDNESLWTHTLGCTQGNFIACNNLAGTLLQQGRTQEAVGLLREALQINPVYSEAHYDLGLALIRQGQSQEAIDEFKKTVRINPAHSDANNDLANLLFMEGQTEEAIPHVMKALELQPDNASYQKNLAWMLATAPQISLRDGTRAVYMAECACKSTTGCHDPAFILTLAAALAQSGDFHRAVQTAQNALHLAENQSNAVLSDEINREIKLYKAGHRFEGVIEE